MPKLYTGAEIVFKCLEEQKVNHIFGYPGRSRFFQFMMN
jgi:acetolactate synthase-1/2/3 large subunit